MRVPWRAVLSGEVEIDEVTLVAPEITLVRAADGRVSWALSEAPATATDTAPRGTTRGHHHRGRDDRWRPDLARRGGRAKPAHRRSRRAIGDARRRIRRPCGARPAVNGTDLSVEAAIADLTGLLNGGLSNLDVALDWSGGAAGFLGRAALSPALEGQVSIEATDLDPLVTLLGAAMPDLPQGYGRDRLALSGRVTLTEDGSAYLRERSAGCWMTPP